jgi:predicted 2-oxoglutarate/Fe(II)-dependent dioxygenase YbiX
MYINDDYEGGETFVLDEESGDEVISYEPKKNTMLKFRSDASCEHGVKEITAGRRLTMSMWFTTLDEYEEPLNY